MAAAPKTKAGGKGLNKKVAGLPLWIWIGAGVGGLMLGLYLRSRSAGASSTGAPASEAGTAGAGATPGDNGLGSSTTDLSGFMQGQADFQQAIAGQISDLTGAIQDFMNASSMGFAGGSFDVGNPADFGAGGEQTQTSGESSGPNLLAGLTPATLKAAWSGYVKAQRKLGFAPTATRTSPAGTTARVPGGLFTQVSGPKPTGKPARPTKTAIWVPSRGGARAHWASPAGKWLS